MERTPQHPTFLDGAAADLGGPRTMAFLDKCERLIPWDELARSVADVFPRPLKPGAGGAPVRRGGRPHWPVKLYVKCLMLQKWFNLSDPQLEEQLRDRISFRRFVGLGLSEPTPDETSMVVFRRRLREAGFNAIRYPSLRGEGANLAVLADFDTILVPQMVSPVTP